MKAKRDWEPVSLKVCLSGVLSLVGVAGSCTFAQAAAPASGPPPAKRSGNTSAAAGTQAANEKAWGILREGLNDQNADTRAKAVRALGLLSGNAEAEKAALSALQDKKRTCEWQQPRRWDPCKPNTPISNWKASYKTPSLRWSSRRQIRCSCSTTTLGMTSTTTC